MLRSTLWLACTAVLLFGCARMGPEVESRRLVDQRPELGAVYEAGLAAWDYFDRVETGRFIEASQTAREAILQARGSFERRCPETPSECQLAAYDRTMSVWVDASGYRERRERIERARTLLAVMRSVLDARAPKSAKDLLRYTDELGELLRAAIEELRASGIPVPSSVDVALGVVIAYLGGES